MDKWKAIAMAFGGFSVGVIYATACSDKGAGDSGPLDSHAADTTVPPPGATTVRARAVVEVYADVLGNECIDDGELQTQGDCCPAGFAEVGITGVPAGTTKYAVVCLENE